LNRPFRQAFARFSDFLTIDAPESPSERDCALIAMLKWVAFADGVITDREMESFRKFVQSRHQGRDISALAAYFRECEPIPPSECLKCFADAGAEERMATFNGMVQLALAGNGYTGERRDEILAFGRALELSGDYMEGVEAELIAAADRRRKLVRSGAGLAVAFIVLLVFVLTATLLRSVIFGLILAYICLPLEKLIERRMLKKHPFDRKTFKPNSGGNRVANRLIGKIRNFVGNSGGEAPTAETSPEKLHRNQLIKRACTATVGLVMFALLLAALLLAALSVRYLNNLGHSVSGWVQSSRQSAAVTADPAMENMDDSMSDVPVAEAPAAATTEEDFFRRVGHGLDSLKLRFQRLPAVSWGIGEISKVLRAPDAQEKFFSALLERSGGIVQFSLRLLSKVAAILLDILLTAFFFSLFIRTVALNTDERGSGQSIGTYCVRTVFNGNWLPSASDDAMAEAEHIVNAVVFKLKTWLKGFIILITIDTVVYSCCFYLLGVPYAFVLGFIAGCGILLPYIGPIASALLTILVTLALGGDAVSGWQIAGIMAVYLVENGVVEQFFLYPAVIGSALGLTTLETIIVVLLGGIFAGITGMIFALPAASVIKYLVPQIYRTVRRR